MLRIESLTAGYGGEPVLKGLDLAVARGEFLVVVGPNGSGKSTLVRAVTGALTPTGGRILLEGRDLRTLRPREVARVLAVVAQDTSVGFDFTVEEVVALGRTPYLPPLRSETPRDRAAVERAMRLTGTAPLAGRVITALSGGERQRVMVARALAQEPRLLILDEPTAHLDIANQVEVLDLVRRLNRTEGLTVLAILHDLNLAALYADRLVMLKDGRVWAGGPPAEVLTEANILTVYGSRVKVVRHP
ncbi:MAG: iron ABC transporter ATP-binding protein, partial [Symbiobacterium thermophilum]